MKPRKTTKTRFLRTPASVAPSEAQPAPGPALDHLRDRLDHWGQLWAPEGEAGSTEAHRVVAARLSGWLERCFGRHVLGSMRGRESRVSLASSTPIFTAFLGRRATRELSRRVLRDM